MQMESVAPCRDREADEGAEQVVRGANALPPDSSIQDQLQMQIG